MKKLFFVLFGLLILGWIGMQRGYAEPQGAYVYVSPRPGATLVSTGQTIAIRPEGELAEGVVLAGLFTVTGSHSGMVAGDIVVAADNATILFKPNQPFHLGESVTVEVAAGVPTAEGQQLTPLRFAFTVSPHKPQLPAVADTAALPRPSQPVEQYRYKTVPFSLPHVEVTVPASHTAEGFIFLTNFDWVNVENSDPYLMIFDNDGELVYYQAHPQGSMPIDFKKQPHGLLTYFDSTDNRFHAVDNSYNEVGTYAAGNGYTTDNHELLLLPNGNAVLMIYDPQQIDMSQIVPGGLSNAIVEGLVLQEIDPAGNVVFQWRSWDHFQITDATINLLEPGRRGTIDYVHGNSIEVDSDGNWIFSSRHLDEVTKISRTTGDIIWRFGGKNNQFTLLNDDQFFARQHDARRLPDGTLSIFDNGLTGPSRSVTYELDEVNMTAIKVWEYVNSEANSTFSLAMGNSQYLPNSHRLVGWGSGAPTVTEIRPDGSKAFELHMASPHVSYRAFRFPWEGVPQTPHIIFDQYLETLYFSSNGVTDPDKTRYRYEIYGGENKNSAVLLETQARTGFENEININRWPDYHYFRIALVDTQTNVRYENDLQIHQLFVPLLGGSAAAVPKAPVFWLPFNEGVQATTFHNGVPDSDWVGSCLPTTCPTMVTAGRWHQARQFTPNDIVTVLPPLPLGINFTVEAWIKTTSTTEWAGIVSTSDKSPQNNPVAFAQMALAADGTLRVEMREDQDQLLLDGTTVINDGRWHHVAFTYEVEPLIGISHTLVIYVDGEVDNLVNTETLFSLSQPILQIGTTRDRAVFFDGVIDEVVVYDRALLAQEIKQRYFSFPPLSE